MRALTLPFLLIAFTSLASALPDCAPCDLPPTSCMIATPSCPAWERSGTWETLYAGSEAVDLLIQDGAAWATFTAAHRRWAPEVDFETQWVAIAIDAWHSQLGEQNRIQTVTRDPVSNGHVITVWHWDDLGGSDLPTRPVQFAVVDRLDDRPVTATFVHAPQVYSCEAGAVTVGEPERIVGCLG